MGHAVRFADDNVEKVILCLAAQIVARLPNGLGIRADIGEGGAQLVGNVGDELLAALLGFALLGHIVQHDQNAAAFLVGKWRKVKLHAALADGKFPFHIVAALHGDDMGKRADGLKELAVNAFARRAVQKLARGGVAVDELAAAVVGDDAIAHVEKQRVELVALVLHGFERGVEHGRHVVECGGQNADLVRRFDGERLVKVAGRDALGALGQFFNGVDHGLGEQERQKHRDEKTDEQCLQNDEQQLRVQRRDRGATVADVDDEAVVAAGDGDGDIHIACGKVAVVADLAVARGEDIFRLLKQLAVLVARSKHFAAAAVENIVVAVARVNAQCAGVGLEHRLQARGAVLLRGLFAQ